MNIRCWVHRLFDPNCANCRKVERYTIEAQPIPLRLPGNEPEALQVGADQFMEWLEARTKPIAE